MNYLLPLFFLLILFQACSKSNPLPNEKNYQANYLAKEALAKIDFQNEELISIYMNHHFYYVRQDGKYMQTLTFDNGADPFSDGLARTKINGKIGFFNTNLEIVLKPIYDFAFPFHKGVAEICTGCKEKQAGEHTMLEGGQWQKINREGLVIE
ncbi:MAG TPA: WG repeat-containing protein [Campylobacterales bacterium]|nr:WG repeat-containing protein [Campylobacterales bacterium]HHS93232.1 WG repeat-containing protein [Campylobacterales bacterium]